MGGFVSIRNSAKESACETQTMNSIRQHWQLNPEVEFLNHGSFGACPRCVFDAQNEYRVQMERDPIRFLAPERELEPKLDVVRKTLAGLIHASSHDIAFVRNATDGVNAVVRSMEFKAGDEIVCTSHGYNACNNAAEFAVSRGGGSLRVARVPFPIRSPAEVLQAIDDALSRRVKLLLVDHVTSPTGMVFPVAEIISLAHAKQIPVMIDGAHAPGMIPLNVTELGVDYYTANHHKWLCAPKVSGFLYVAAEHQETVRPTVISHAANRARPNRSKFISEFDWNGTYDVTPLLSVPNSIEFLAKLVPGGLAGLMASNREKTLRARELLCEAFSSDVPVPDEMIGSLATFPLPAAAREKFQSADALQARLYDRHRIELPIFDFGDSADRMLRVSLQAYNELDQIHRLCDALREELSL